MKHDNHIDKSEDELSDFKSLCNEALQKVTPCEDYELGTNRDKRGGDKDDAKPEEYRGKLQCSDENDDINDEDHVSGNVYAESGDTNGTFSITNATIIDDSYEISDDNNDEDDKLLIEMAKNGISINNNNSPHSLLWDDSIKSKLKNKIYKTSKKMYLKYGNNGTCFDNFDYIPYFCSTHNNTSSNIGTHKHDHNSYEMENAVFASKSCNDCKLSILDNFIKVIVDTIDKHSEFPPTIQRICELLCFPDCYTNTKSFLFALDKLVCVSIPIQIDNPSDRNENINSDSNGYNDYDLDLALNIKDTLRDNNSILMSLLNQKSELDVDYYKDNLILNQKIQDEDGNPDNTYICDDSLFPHSSSFESFFPQNSHKSNRTSVQCNNDNVENEELPKANPSANTKNKRSLPFKDEDYYYDESNKKPDSNGDEESYSDNLEDQLNNGEMNNYSIKNVCVGESLKFETNDHNNIQNNHFDSIFSSETNGSSYDHLSKNNMNPKKFRKK